MSKKLNHRQKLILARKHRTNSEIKENVGFFQTQWWEKRKKKIRNKVNNSKMRKNK